MMPSSVVVLGPCGLARVLSDGKARHGSGQHVLVVRPAFLKRDHVVNYGRTWTCRRRRRSSHLDRARIARLVAAHPLIVLCRRVLVAHGLGP